MCTAVAMHGAHFFFGRNMDIEGHFGEQVVAVPRNYRFVFRKSGELSEHHAILGMARMCEGYPLFADACNEHGLCMAGLHFPGNAEYAAKPTREGIALAPFELIPWLLGKCSVLQEVREELEKICVIDLRFREDIPNTPLHWMIADKTGAIVLEIMADGMHVYDNPTGVLTNNPPFPFHLSELSRYAHLHTGYGEGMFGQPPFCAGLGAVGLPGDYSSPSRFVRAAWLRHNMKRFDDRTQELAQTFRLLSSVAPPPGCVQTASGEEHYTVYSAVMEAGSYRYRDCMDDSVKEASLEKVVLDGDAPILLSTAFSG